MPLELADEFDAPDVRFTELGYTREVRTRYANFVAAHDRGLVEPGVCFEFRMPALFAVLRAFLTSAAVAAVEESISRPMLAELGEIARQSPHADRVFQWDVAPEMMEWDAGSNAGGLLGTDGRAGILGRLTRLLDAVPADVKHCHRSATEFRSEPGRETAHAGGDDRSVYQFDLRRRGPGRGAAPYGDGGCGGTRFRYRNALRDRSWTICDTVRNLLDLHASLAGNP